VSILGHDVSLATASIVDGQRALQEIAEVQRPVAPAYNLPVKEAHFAIGQDVGVADMRATVKQSLRRPCERVQISNPGIRNDVLHRHGPDRRGHAAPQHLQGCWDGASHSRPGKVGLDPFQFRVARDFRAPVPAVHPGEAARAARGLFDDSGLVESRGSAPRAATSSITRM
jgi:hypothetical protein